MRKGDEVVDKNDFSKSKTGKNRTVTLIVLLLVLLCFGIFVQNILKNKNGKALERAVAGATRK